MSGSRRSQPRIVGSFFRTGRRDTQPAVSGAPLRAAPCWLREQFIGLSWGMLKRGHAINVECRRQDRHHPPSRSRPTGEASGTVAHERFSAPAQHRSVASGRERGFDVQADQPGIAVTTTEGHHATTGRTSPGLPPDAHQHADLDRFLASTPDAPVDLGQFVQFVQFCLSTDFCKLCIVTPQRSLLFLR